MSNITIYEKYGGFDFFHNTIYQLYIELFDHIEISYHFFGVDLQKLSMMQAQFLCQAIGGPPMYKGGNIQIVHKHMKVTEYEFETVVDRFQEIFERNGLDKDEVKFIVTFIRSNRDMIVTSKNSWMDRIARYFYKRFFKFKKFLKQLS
jgi:hemoglobin